MTDNTPPMLGMRNISGIISFGVPAGDIEVISYTEGLCYPVYGVILPTDPFPLLHLVNRKYRCCHQLLGCQWWCPIIYWACLECSTYPKDFVRSSEGVMTPGMCFMLM